MPGDQQQSYPLPDDPVLAEAAAALRETGHWAWVVDAHQRLVFVTDELRRTFGGLVELAPFAIGKHIFGPEAVRASQQWRLGSNTIELQRRFFVGLGGVILADTPGGHDELREIVDPALRDIVDDLSPEDPAMLSFFGAGTAVQGSVDIPIILFRIRDHDGELVGTVLISKPAAGMATIATMTSMEISTTSSACSASHRQLGDRPRSCSPTSRLPPCSVGAFPPPVTSPWVGALFGRRINASWIMAVSSAATSATASSPSSSPSNSVPSPRRLWHVSRPRARTECVGPRCRPPQ